MNVTRWAMTSLLLMWLPIAGCVSTRHPEPFTMLVRHARHEVPGEMPFVFINDRSRPVVVDPTEGAAIVISRVWADGVPIEPSTINGSIDSTVSIYGRTVVIRSGGILLSAKGFRLFELEGDWNFFCRGKLDNPRVQYDGFLVSMRSKRLEFDYRVRTQDGNVQGPYRLVSICDDHDL